MAKYSSDKRPAATPKTKKAWDQPSPPTKGDEKQETTFVAVGRALTAWEEFESAFAHLFSEVIGVSGDNLPAIRAYGAVLTFRGRAEMMEAAAEAYFFEHPQEKLQRDMKNLLTAAKGFAARRNEIAHGIVRNRMVPSHVIMNRQGGMLQMSKARGWAVEPSDYMTGKTDLAA